MSHAMANQAQQAPWSVKGIAPQTREAVKEAARRSGMTIGEWLNAAITHQAQRPLPSRLESPTPHDLRWAEIAAHLAKYVQPEAARAAPPSPAPSMTSTHAIEQLLKEAQARSAQMTREQSMRIAEALTGLAHYIKRSEQQRLEEVRRVNAEEERTNANLAHTLALVAHRIKRLERQLTHLPQDIVAPIKEAATHQADTLASRVLPAMEQRLNTQMRNILNSLPAIQPHVAAATSPEKAHPIAVDAEQLKVQDRLARAIVDIRSRQVELARQEANVDNDISQQEILKRLEKLSRQLDAALSSHQDKGSEATLGVVLTRLDRIDSRLNTSATSPDLARLENMVQSLSENVEALHLSSKTLSIANTNGLDTLAAQISQLAQHLDDTARHTLRVAREDQGEAQSGQHEHLAALETAISTLSLQLRHLPQADTDTLERMARIAAREALTALSMDGKTEPHDRRARTDNALDTVHSTLERVIDRLAQLEDTICARNNDGGLQRNKFTGEPERRAARALAQAEMHHDTALADLNLSDGPENLLARETVGLTDNMGLTANFIAAARRAAIAAADETRFTTSQIPMQRDHIASQEQTEDNAETAPERRRSLLISLGALIAATGAAHISTMLIHSTTRLS